MFDFNQVELFGGVISFSLIMMLLVVFVMLARKILLLAGNARLTINEVQPVNVTLGQTLLMALAENGVYLSAACGGKGICGQCQVKVVAGNNPLVSTESLHISQQQAAQGIRLACAFKISGDLSVQLAGPLINKRRFHCKVVSNHLVSTFMTELILEPLKDEPLEFEAGDYILLEAPPCTVNFSDLVIPKDYLPAWKKFRLFGLETQITEKEIRAYSFANAPSKKSKIQLLVRIATPPASAPENTPAGKVSSYIFSLKTGDKVSITGPFGKFHCRENDKEMLLIGGGAGMAPLRSMIQEQLIGLNSQRKLSFWYGARSKQQLCYEVEFEQLSQQFQNFDWQVALSEPLAEDNWTGQVGFIHMVVLKQYLALHPSPQNIDYYICGPPLMSAATITMLNGLGVSNENIFYDDFGGNG